MFWLLDEAVLAGHAYINSYEANREKYILYTIPWVAKLAASGRVATETPGVGK